MGTAATIQIDVDGWWAYAAAYGETAPLEPDPVFADALPRLRALLDRHEVRATLFVVGADLTVGWKRRLIEEMARDGHELANHTYGHPLGLPGLSEAEIVAEIDRGAEAVADLTGGSPAGFRAPGYAIDERICALLAERGYQYDSSLLPTFWGALLRAMQRRGATATVESPPLQFGRALYGFAPGRPYYPSSRCLWSRGDGGLVEVPVSTLPGIRFPFHSTCVFRLGGAFLDAALLACRAARMPVNYVFHAVDLIDDELGEPLLRRIGVRASLAARTALCDQIITGLARQGRLLPTREWLADMAHPRDRTAYDASAEPLTYAAGCATGEE